MESSIIFTPHIYHESGWDDTLNGETSPGLYAGTDDNRYLVYYNSYGRHLLVLQHKTIPRYTAYDLDDAPKDKVTRCGDGAIALSSRNDRTHQAATLGELFVAKNLVSMMVHCPAHKMYMPEMIPGETEAEIGYYRIWGFVTETGEPFFVERG